MCLRQFFRMQGINPIDLGDPWSKSLEVIAFHSVKHIAGYQTNGH